jgi:hypothetical protein
MSDDEEIEEVEAAEEKPDESLANARALALLRFASPRLTRLTRAAGGGDQVQVCC